MASKLVTTASKIQYCYDGTPTVSNFYSTSSMQLEILLSCAVEAASCSRSELVFRSWPPELESLASAFGITVNQYIIRMKIDVFVIMGILAKVKDEAELVHKIGENVYILIKYVILNAKQYFTRTSKLFASVEGEGRLMQFKMIHTADSESRFNGKKTRFLFHGSGFENWNNIFSNGLKCTSGENAKLLVNANAYGAGIYLSDNPGLSLRYCWSKCGRNENFILSVVEIVDKAAIHKSQNIFLATDESALLLRYIIYFDKTMNGRPEFLKQLDKLLERLTTSNTKNANRHKRLTGELARMIVPPGIIVNPICTNGRFTTSWQIIYNDFSMLSTTTTLMKQLIHFEIKQIEVEFMFGSNFPFSPPFIRLVSPRITYNPSDLTKNPNLAFLDAGGGICTAIFKTGEWTPGYPLINIICDVQCMLLMTEGLRLHDTLWNSSYSVKEALTSFNSVIGTFEPDEAIDLLDSY